MHGPVEDDPASPSERQSGLADMRDLNFLAGGSEMALLLRGFDWSRNPLGPPDMWPDGLRTAVRIMLTTRHPMFIFWGTDHICLYNDAYREVLGDEKHPSIVGMPGKQAWPETWHEIGPQIELVMAGKGSTWHDNQHLPILRHGCLDDVYWTYSYGPLDHPDAPSGVGGVLVICTETTSRILSEKRINTELDRMRRLFDQAPGFMCVFRGPDHVFESANKAFTDLFGLDAVVGKRLVDLLPEADSQGFVALLNNVYANGEPYVGTDRRFVREPGDGSGRVEGYYSFVYAPIVGEDDRVSGIFVQGIDVTVNRQAAEALAASEARFRAAIGAVKGVLWTNDAAGRMTGEQPGWTALTGQSLAEYEGYGWASAVHPDDSAATLVAWQAAVAERRIFAHEHRLRRADGEWRNYSIRAVPIIGDDGDIVEWVGVHTDITEQREAETALRALNADLEARVAAAVAAQLQVENTLRQAHKTEALGQLVGGVAHDFNNMLAVVTSSMQLIERRFADADPDLLRLVRLGHESAMRAAALTDRMLAFARQQPMSPTIVDVNLLLGDLRQLFGHALGHGIRLDYDLEAAALKTRIDRSQLENAIVNLVVNARDAMARKGRLLIETRRLHRESQGQAGALSGDYASIAVSDTGAGMTPDVQAKVFDPFFTTKPAGEGTGLGLSQVYGLVRQFDGDIEIVSVPGQGTRVTIYLPLAPG